MTSTVESTPIASQAGHWYDRTTGEPCYEMPCKSKDGMRPTTIRDARQHDLVPSVTAVLNCMAKPGLEAWKSKQLLEASLTLPKRDDETLDDYAKRVVEDAKAQGIAAADRGTQLHKAIERYIGRHIEPEWHNHLDAVDAALQTHGAIDLFFGEPEHSFATEINGMSYGGKVDYHSRAKDDLPDTVIDFKSKDVIEPKKQLAFDDHVMQLAAYGFGLFGRSNRFRALNVFVGVNDCKVRIIEHGPEDLERGFQLFLCVLEFWSRKNRFGKVLIMIIPFISKYRQQFHYERIYWMTKRERKRAVMFVCAIMACVTALVYLWLK